MKRIAIVEDEVFMREELGEILQKAGYEVVSVEDFEKVEEELSKAPLDLVLLDLNLPGKSGFQICRELKRKGTTPVCVLTSRDQMADELRALELGADEYLTKPCRKERLLARVSNVLKRYEGRKHLLEGKNFLLDQQTYTLYIHDDSIVMPKNQGKLLEVFLKKRGQIVTKEELSIALWNTTEFIDENALQVNLTRLKKTMQKLHMEEEIETIRGTGYRLETR